MTIENATFNANSEGKLSLGNQIINLTDESKKIFKTASLASFSFFASHHAEETEIYFNEAEVWQVPKKAAANFLPLAHCAMESAQPLKVLESKIGKTLSIEELETLLRSLRPYAVGKHLEILSNLRNFSTSKKNTYARDVSANGDYRLLIQREAVAGDWIPPAGLLFVVPIFAYGKETVNIETEFFFTVNEATSAPVFRLENLCFSEIISERRKEVIEDILSEIDVPQYWGTFEHKTLNDGWKYRENKATL